MREELLVADNSNGGPDTSRMTAAALAATAACVLLAVYLWTDPDSKLLLVVSGVFSLVSAATSFSVLRARRDTRA
jgi:hypothetical protein